MVLNLGAFDGCGIILVFFSLNLLGSWSLEWIISLPGMRKVNSWSEVTLPYYFYFQPRFGPLGIEFISEKYSLRFGRSR